MRPVTDDVRTLQTLGRRPTNDREARRVLQKSRLVRYEGALTVDGVEVQIDVAFEGMKGACAYAIWTLYNGRTRRPVGREWLRNRSAVRWSMDRDDAGGAGAFWVPLPKRTGPYYVRAGIFNSDGHKLAADNTAKFDGGRAGG